MKSLTWNEKTSKKELKRLTFPFTKTQTPSIKSWNTLFKKSTLNSLTASSSQRSFYVFLTSSLPDLPDHVWKYIFGFLDARSLSVMVGTCRSLYDIALTPELWKLHCFESKIDCGPGIEHLLDKVNGHKGKWWREVYIRGIMGRQSWFGGYKKRLVQVSEVDDAITCFKFDNDRVIVGTRNHARLYQSNIDFWNTITPKYYCQYEGAHKSPIMCLDFSSLNGNILATGDADGILGVWNIYTGELLARQKRAHDKGISQVIMLDNRHIATCGFDKLVKVFRLQEFTIGNNYSPTASRTSSQLLEPIPKKKFFWSKVEKQRPKTTVSLVKEFRGHKGEIYCMQGICKKTKLATGSTDRSIKIWDIKTSACEKTLVGHSDTITSLAVAGDLLFSGSLDKIIKVWRISTGECVSMLIGHTEWIKSLAISGTILISGGWEEIIHLWDIEKLKLVKRIKMDVGTITNIQSDRQKIVSVGREEGFQHQLAIIDFDRI